MNDLLNIMRQLRGPDGCPWDQKQTHDSLRKYMLEEAYEAVDAISKDDTEHIVEELGDVLLQIAFHTVIAEETERFSYEMIEKGIVDKLIRRHPHIFADTDVADADEVVTNWYAIKAREKEAREKEAREKEGKEAAPVVEQLPSGMPSMMQAVELGKTLAWAKVDEAEVRQNFEQALDTQDVGKMLLAVVDYARSQKVQPEIALRDSLGERVAEHLES